MDSNNDGIQNGDEQSMSWGQVQEYFGPTLITTTMSGEKFGAIVSGDYQQNGNGQWGYWLYSPTQVNDGNDGDPGNYVLNTMYVSADRPIWVQDNGSRGFFSSFAQGFMNGPPSNEITPTNLASGLGLITSGLGAGVRNNARYTGDFSKLRGIVQYLNR
jgi:hypothetical protein